MRAKILRTKFTPKTRYLVFNKFSGRCAYCGHPITFDKMQIDHIVPDYSNNTFSNLNPSCYSCNFLKSNHDLEKFRSLVSVGAYNLSNSSHLFRALLRYGQIQLNLQPVQFYFETKHV